MGAYPKGVNALQGDQSSQAKPLRRALQGTIADFALLGICLGSALLQAQRQLAAKGIFDEGLGGRRGADGFQFDT